MINVSELAIYPLKSCRQHTVNRWPVDNFSFAGDRRWMLVNQETGRFITQRSHPVMVMIECLLIDDGLVLSAQGYGTIKVSEPVDDTSIQVSIWKDKCTAIDAGDTAAQWCSALIETECRLVYMPDSSFRQVDLKYVDAGVRTGFADGFPFLLISEASLADLNERLEDPVPMLRFRPNIVVSGCEAYAEDSWKCIRIGDIEFTVAKACTRCVMTTINPDTLEKHKEPLKTLASYRRTESGVIFGQNLVHHGVGELQVGMSVEVLD